MTAAAQLEDVTLPLHLCNKSVTSVTFREQEALHLLHTSIDVYKCNTYPRVTQILELRKIYRRRKNLFDQCGTHWPNYGTLLGKYLQSWLELNDEVRRAEEFIARLKKTGRFVEPC